MEKNSTILVMYRKYLNTERKNEKSIHLIYRENVKITRFYTNTYNTLLLVGAIVDVDEPRAILQPQ